MPPKTVNVEEAGQILGIGRNSAYEAGRRGEIPVIKIGKLLRVPVVALERMLEEARPTSRDST
jgi:excisionase family DNA binding protein